MSRYLKTTFFLSLSVIISLMLLSALTQNLATAQIEDDLVIVTGRAVDGRTGESLENAQVIVSMQKLYSINEITRTLNSNSPTYKITVEPGDWILRFEKKNYEDYLHGYEIKDISPIYNYQMSLSSREIVTTNVTFFEEDASLTGQVTDINGDVLRNHPIYFKGINELAGVAFHAESDVYGQLDVDLPHGSYDVSLASVFQYPDEQSGFNPPPKRITIEKGEVLQNFEIGYVNNGTNLSILVLAEGITQTQRIRMSMSNDLGDSRVSTNLDLISDGKNAVGYTNIVRGDNRIFKYLLSDNARSGPHGKGMFEVSGPTQIVLRYEILDSTYPWDGVSADLNPLEKFELDTGRGIKVEMAEGTMIGPEESRMWLHADVDQFPIQQGYFLIGNDHQFREVRQPAYPHFFAQNAPFQKPVTVTMPFDLNEYPTLSPDDIKISIAYGKNASEFYFPFDWFGWDYRSELIDPIAVDEVNQTVTFLIDEPGSFGLVVPTQKFIDSVGFFPNKVYFPVVLDQ